MRTDKKRKNMVSSRGRPMWLAETRLNTHVARFFPPVRRHGASLARHSAYSRLHARAWYETRLRDAVVATTAPVEFHEVVATAFWSASKLEKSVKLHASWARCVRRGPCSRPFAYFYIYNGCYVRVIRLHVIEQEQAALAARAFFPACGFIIVDRRSCELIRYRRDKWWKVRNHESLVRIIIHSPWRETLTRALFRYNQFSWCMLC